MFHIQYSLTSLKVEPTFIDFIAFYSNKKFIHIMKRSAEDFDTMFQEEDYEDTILDDVLRTLQFHELKLSEMGRALDKLLLLEKKVQSCIVLMRKATKLLDIVSKNYSSQDTINDLVSSDKTVKSNPNGKEN